MRYPNRLIGYAWLGVTFMEPSRTKFDLDAALVAVKQAFGREMGGYWQFFDKEDAGTIIENNVSSCIILSPIHRLSLELTDGVMQD